jgi:hypothetical protein
MNSQAHHLMSTTCKGDLRREYLIVDVLYFRSFGFKSAAPLLLPPTDVILAGIQASDLL